jgi:hypothetical protein
MKSTVVWITTPGYALLAMTDAGFFSSLRASVASGNYLARLWRAKLLKRSQRAVPGNFP